jgi:hypothetical protein
VTEPEVTEPDTVPVQADESSQTVPVE